MCLNALDKLAYVPVSELKKAFRVVKGQVEALLRAGTIKDKYKNGFKGRRFWTNVGLSLISINFQTFCCTSRRITWSATK